MQPQFERTAMLLGEQALEYLATKRVAVFGLGGVGGHAVEALARSGVGHFALIDNDTVAVSNINRQLIADLGTVGQAKVDVMERRILSINPAAQVEKYQMFYLPDTADAIDLAQFDYVVDAIDTVSAKLNLAERCAEAGIPLVAALGCGNKLDPTRLTVCDIFDTQGDPLAKVMRHEMRTRGVQHLKVVCSTEPPLAPRMPASDGGTRRATPGSTAFVPPVAGILLASEVVKDLLAEANLC